MAVNLVDNILCNTAKPLDAKYYNFNTGEPWSNVATVKSSIASQNRFKGLTVAVWENNQIVEYWWKDGVADNQLVQKSTLAGYVPYTGATANVELGSRYLRTNTILYVSASNNSLFNTNKITEEYIQILGSDGSNYAQFNLIDGVKLQKLSGLNYAYAGLELNDTFSQLVISRQSAKATIKLDNAVLANQTILIPDASAIGGTGTLPFGTGTSGYISKWQNSNNLTTSLIYDNTFGVSIGNGTSVDASAVFHLNSITRGFLPPRMTLAQRNAIVAPADGLMVYQTDSTKGIYVYDSSGPTWRRLNWT